MTPLQFDRWKDFASRMARTCYSGNRRPTGKWIVDVVSGYFDSVNKEDLPFIVDWCNSNPYPEGHPRRFRGVISGWTRPFLVCDDVSEFLDNYRGYPPRCKKCSEYDRSGECRCDEIDHLFYEQWDEQWGGPVHCCIRAGLDFAANPSAGVLGFTAGDIRRMFPEGVPEWVFPTGERLAYWPGDKLNGTFAELPDTAGVVM